MSHRRRRTSSRWPLLLSLVLAAPLAGVPRGLAQEGGLFVDTVDVDVVNLEVVVTDKQGNPVHGLTAEDFKVFEDGEPVELSNFYAVESARRVLPPEEAQAAIEDPTVTALPPDQRLNLAVTVDNTNINPANRKRVIDQLKLQIGKVSRPGDRMMVVSLNPDIRVEQSFTDDVGAVLAALDRLATSTAARIDLLAQERMIRNAIATRDGGDGGGGGGGGFAPESQDTPEQAADRVLNLIQSYATQADARSRETFAALGNLIDSLAGLEGRNAVLYVSDGVSTRPAEALLEELELQFSDVARSIGISNPSFEANRWDSSDAMRDVAKRAAADRVVFYSMDAKGTFGSSGIESVALGAPGTTGLVEMNSKDAMMYFAAATGGDVMLNPAGVDKLIDRIASDYTDYYSLGYSSPKSQDGKYHRIEIKVPEHKGLRVRHTEGYRGKSFDQRMSERTLSALVLDVADNPLNVQIELGAEQAAQRKQYVVPLLIKVPINRLVLVPQEKEHVGKITIYIAVQDSRGRVAQPDPIEVPVNISNEQLLQALARELGHGLNLQLRGGESKLAIGVRDDIAAVESTVNLNVTLGQQG